MSETKVKLQNKLEKLLTYLQPFLQDKSEEISKLINEASPDSLDSAFTTMCYYCNSNEEYADLGSNLSIAKFDFGRTYRLLLKYLYEEYDKAEKLDFEQIFPECSELFKNYNATMLLPTDIIVDKPPAGAIIVKFAVENCKNLIFDMNPLINKEYVKAKYGEVTDATGINNLIISRFKNVREYEENTDENNYIIDKLSDNIYQKIDSKNYRKLINYSDYSRNLDHLNYNIYICNWENKKILAMKKPMRKDKASFNSTSILGIIKNNIYEKKMHVMPAVYNAVYNENMSDEDVLRLIYHAHVFGDKMPKGKISPEAANKIFNLRFIADMGLS
jgi:hypothetical protein